MTPSPPEDPDSLARKAHMPPGTLVYVGPDAPGNAVLRIVDYGQDVCEQVAEPTVEEAVARARADRLTWIDVAGPGDAALIGALGEGLGIHRLTLEDLMNTRQRPKLEEYGDYLFVVLRVVRANGDDVGIDQVGMILSQRYVLTVHEGPETAWDPIRRRMDEPQSRLRRRQLDYLVYAIIDAVIDGYFVVLEGLSDRIEHIEEQLLAETGPTALHQIHDLKRQLLSIKRASWPQREVAATLQRSESPLIGDDTRVYLRDVYDHTVQVIDLVESQRDTLGSLNDLYMSGVSLQMNQVMQLLSVIATIFMPLTFVAGLYGMNFKHMPELEWRWAYPALLVSLVLIAAGMVAGFRRRGWL